jgi:hypothetical protein
VGKALFGFLRVSLRAALTPAAVAGVLFLPATAFAQDIGITAPAPRVEATATPDDVLHHSIDASTGISTVPAPGDDGALAVALNYDPLMFAVAPPKKPLRGPGYAMGEGETKWSGGAKADGSGSISVNKTLPTEWDTKVGGDLALAGTPATTYDPSKPLPGLIKEQRSGAAWANVTVPDLATVELRLAPSDEQRKVATSIQRSVPIGNSVSVTLQNGLSVTENYPVTPAGAPLQVWGSERKVKLNIVPTGTTLAAASSNSSTKNLTHHTLSAEQKIYGPLNVTTSMTDPGQQTASKSVTAGFKLNW